MLVLALLLLLASIRASPCNSTTYADFYFELCLNSTACAYHLDLHSGDAPLFENLLLHDLLQPSGLTADDMCIDENVTRIWLGVISRFPFCQWNQIPDIEVGCICRTDRLCVAEHPTKFSLNTVGYWITASLMILVIGYAVFSLTKAIKENRSKTQSGRF